MSVLQALAELSATRLLNSVAEGMLVAVLAWALLRVLGRQNSGTRFAIWLSALAAIAALPFIGFNSQAGLRGRPEISIASSWAGYLFAAWAVVAGIAITRIAIGLWRVRQLRVSCTPLEEFVTSHKCEDRNLITEEHRGNSFTTNRRRKIRICVSERVHVPTAVGFFSPMVLLPKWTVEQLSAEELNAVILHELAHLRRWDDWSNLAQKVIRALLFFHPAVWWIDNRLTLEREMACDDLVLAETADPRGYAECLVSLAEKNFFRRGLAMAQAAVGRFKHMSLRIARILDHQRPGATRVWKPAVALLAIFSSAGVVAVSHTSPLIGFIGPEMPVAADSSVHMPTSMVVPAALHNPVPLQSASDLHVKGKSQRPMRRALRPGPLMAHKDSNTWCTKGVPKVVAAKAPAPTSAFVVVQTTFYQSSQGAIWTMTVWQVQAGSAQEKQVVKLVDPRSI